MNVKDLTRDQLTEAKAQMVIGSLNENGTKYEFVDIMFPDDVITDAEAYAYYADVCFAEDDFFCSEM